MAASMAGAGGGGGATAVGGAGGEPADRGQSLCDGTQRLRLWALVDGGQSGPAGSQVRIENGSPFLAVDGACRYWLSGGWQSDSLSRDRGVRAGELDAPEAEALEQALSFSDVASLADCQPPVGIYDASTRSIRTDSGTAACTTSGARFDAAWAALQTLAQTLWARGLPLTGALHVSAAPAPYDPSTSPAEYPWPIATPLATFILGGPDLSSSGVSRLVDDASAAAQLRTLREQYLADRTAQPGLYVHWDGLKVTGGGQDALLYMRDATPYEDTHGLFHF